MSLETWRVITEFPNYAVSNRGYVKRLTAPLRGSKTFPGKILATSISNWGYVLVHLHSRERDTRRPVHRLVAEAFLGPCPLGREVNHKSGNKRDNSLGNIEYVTKSQNIAHAYRLGLRNHQGSHHPRATISESDVLSIRAIARTSVSNIVWGHEKQRIAERFGTTVRVIESVRSRQNWKHV